MRTSSEIPLKVRKITIKDSQTTLVLHMDDSHPDPAEAQTSEVPVAYPHAGICQKKLVGKKRKFVESEGNDSLTTSMKTAAESTPVNA